MPDSRPLSERLAGAYRRLRQWGRITASRLFGTLGNREARYLAVMGLEERTLWCRAELTALIKLVVPRLGITDEQLSEAILEELHRQADGFEQQMPEIKLTEAGFTITDTLAFRARTQRENWPL